jgi:hypothetical protein
MAPSITRLWYIAAIAVATAGTVEARGLGVAAELEAARASARAGGPVNGRDAELLERYGCLSGTNNDFCRKLEARGRDHPSHRRGKRPQD